MTHDDIIQSAISVSGELPLSASGDYSVRAVSLLALIYNQCIPLDKIWRQVNGLPESTWIPDTKLHDLTGSFPLSDVFLGIVPFALASLLVIDEDTELSKQYYSRYLAGLAEIRRMIPASTEPIADRYHLI
ncbi:MAG: hypothetical protein E7680_01400 [Ruminococcaceae bacterium]|nr:hypothetical protein [Oscillospiraceae bacterium]